jgi:hypothetical protein
MKNAVALVFWESAARFRSLAEMRGRNIDRPVQELHSPHSATGEIVQWEMEAVNPNRTSTSINRVERGNLGFGYSPAVTRV